MTINKENSVKIDYSDEFKDYLSKKEKILNMMIKQQASFEEVELKAAIYDIDLHKITDSKDFVHMLVLESCSNVINYCRTLKEVMNETERITDIVINLINKGYVRHYIVEYCNEMTSQYLNGIPEFNLVVVKDLEATGYFKWLAAKFISNVHPVLK